MNTTTRDKLPEETQKQKEDGDLSYFGKGDTYTVDDDNTEAGIYISADDKAAKVDINVRQYIYRPMMGNHSGTVEVYEESESREGY